MARKKLFGVATVLGNDGELIKLDGATVEVFQKGTVTSIDLYDAETGGTPVSVLTDADGEYSFWIDAEYVNKQIKIKITKTGYDPIEDDGVQAFPEAEKTVLDGSAFSGALSGAENNVLSALQKADDITPAGIGAEPADSTIMKEGENVSLLTNDADYQSGAQVDSDIATHTADANAHHTQFTPTEHDARDHTAVANTIALDELGSKDHSEITNKNAETDIKHVTDDEKDALDNAPNPLTETNPVIDYSFIASVMKGFVHNLLMSMNDSNPDYQVDIGEGRCVSDDGTDFIVSDSVLTVDITSSGAGGLDTGSEASSTWYAVWIIKNPTTGDVDGLLSTSFTSPTLPSGYTKKRRIGSIYNDSGSDFYSGRYEGSGSRRYWVWGDDILVLSGGSATSFTDVDASDSAPPSSRLLYVRLNMGGTSFAEFTFRENGSTALIPDREYAYVDIGGHIFIPVDENQIFEYYVSSGDDAEIRVQGYWEDI